MSLRVLLADDHQLVREGCRALLEREGFEVVGEAADGCEAVRLALAHVPDVAILDLYMPQLDGLGAASEIMRACPKTTVVVLTISADEHQVVAALRVGIRGYVVKTQAAEELVGAIREVAGGGTYLSPRVSHAVDGAGLAGSDLLPDGLARQERVVLQLVAEGKTTKQIATLLGVSVKSAETYRSRLMAKLGIHDTAGLVRYAVRRGLIQASVAWTVDFLNLTQF